MGTFGYFHYGLDTKGNVLQNCFPTKDPMVIVSFAAITLTIVMAFPLVVFPCRYTLDIMLQHLFESSAASAAQGESSLEEGSRREIPAARELERKEEDGGGRGVVGRDVSPTTSKCRHLTLTTLICASALSIALFVSKIQVVFQLMGGTTSAFVCFILPAAFALQLHSTGRLVLSPLEKLAAWGLAIGGFIVGVMSTYVTVLEIIQG
jgi:amino acid permease